MSKSSESKRGQAEAFLIEQAATALFRLGRLFGRQSLRERLGDDARPEFSQLMIVQSLADSERSLGIGDIAQQLNVDPSTASRLVRHSVKDGYVERLGSEHDGRAVVLRLTPAGKRLAAQARAWQTEIFGQATADWTAAERQDFASLFLRFAGKVSEIYASGQDGD